MDTQSQSPLLVQIHMAEYNALTSRNTYFIAISFSFWPALILYLGFLPLLKDKIASASILVSIGILGSELITLGWYFCLWETFKSVRYLESELKRKIIPLIQSHDFWGYEPYLQPLKGQNYFVF